MTGTLTFKPVTKAKSEDFEALFETPGAPKYCWCMAYRNTAEEKKGAKSADLKKQMFSRIADGVPVGLVGYLKGEPIAWVSIAPRDTYRNLGAPEAGDGERIWALACMFIRKDHRGEGLGHELIAGAVAHARKKKASVVEAYPVDEDSPSYRFMGFVPAFKKAGFVEGGRIGTRRHLMRLVV